MSTYIRNPKEIYRRSFAIVREETMLDDLPVSYTHLTLPTIYSV